MDIDNLIASMEDIDEFLNRMLNHAGVECEQLAISAIAGAIAEETSSLDNQAKEIIKSLSGAIVSAIANKIAATIASTKIKILSHALLPQNREGLLTQIGVTNHRKNYDRYMLPLVNKGWLAMTIPHKSTSPKQQYLTTLKGRLILEILKYKTQ